jgi:phosphoglycerate dehydrogenase-like enzyme
MTQAKWRLAHQFTHPWVRELIQSLCPADIEVVFWDRSQPGQAEQVLPSADFVVCLSLSPAEAQLLEGCKLVMHNGVGFDGIATEVLKARHIPLALSPQLTPEGVSEHVFTLVLALLKNLVPVQADMRNGQFGMFQWRERGRGLAGKRFGIVGLGRIGKQVALLAHAFGCDVFYNDLVPAPAPLVQTLALTAVSLPELLEQSDIVTVHVPLTDLTRGMFSGPEFARMKSDALFINTSRGATYDLSALNEAIAAGHLAGAGLDVFSPEPPPPDHPIFAHPNVLTTPHMASGTIERQYAVNQAQFENCRRVLDGLPIANQVDLNL